MGSIRLSVVFFGVLGAATLAAMVHGCGSDATPARQCGNSDSCQVNDPACSRPCGRNQAMACSCGSDGTLVCNECADVNNGTGGRAAGGRSGRGTGGATAATGGRSGRGTGGSATASGGASAGTGGRQGRGTGGMNNSSGGITGSGGFVPSDAGTPTCPAAGASCTASATPVCQTECVSGMYSICTCVGGAFVCPTSQIPCP